MRSAHHAASCDALHDSWVIQSEASAQGFDWPDITGVFAKVREETGEIESAWSAADREHAKREFGDLLFAIVNLGRFLDADPAVELARANARFTRRFALLKEEVLREGLVMRDCTLDALDVIWERVKRRIVDEQENGS